MIHYLILLLGVVSHVLAAPTNINIQDIIDPHAEGGSAGIADGEDFDAVAFLEAAHYLDKADRTKGRHHAPDSVKQGLREFQAFTGLNVTGRLDKATVTMMETPRCGDADVIRPSERTNKDSNAPLAYTLNTKWTKNDLTYKFSSFTRDLPEMDQRRTVADALNIWSAVTPLNFHRVADDAEADITVGFGAGDHGDAWPFVGGIGGVLAHAFEPSFPLLSGDLHFDDDEDWTINSPDGQNLLQVAIHELGHSMGLGHTADQNSIMFPYTLGYKENPQLGQDDIRGIQSHYGPRPGGPTARPTPPPTLSQSARLCDVRFDAIEQVHDGKIYGFSSDLTYEITGRGKPQRALIGNVFKGAPSSPGAVVYDKSKKRTFFFKGTQFWRFSGYNLDQGFPKELAVAFQNPTAAMWKDNFVHLFQEGRIARWYEGMERASTRSTNTYFNNAPANIDAAFIESNGYTYLFKDTQYWRYEGSTLSEGFPKDNRPFWLECGLLRDRDLETLGSREK